MKLLYRLILLIISTCSVFLLMSHFYLNRMMTPDYLQKFINQLDLMAMVESEIPSDYKMILESKQFETIVSDYAYTFGLHLLGKESSYTISDEMEEELFQECYELFLKDYPQFEFLPASLFIDYLVKTIDLNSYLPSFEKLESKVPDQFMSVILRLKGQNTFSILILAIVLLLIVSPKMLALGAFINAGLLFFISLGTFVPFSFYEKGLFMLLGELHVEIKYSIILAVGCIILDWGIYYAKKIFLF